MKKYIFRRVMISIATLLVIVLVLFLLMDLMPGTPFNDEKLSEAQIAMLYAKYGLDKPLLVRFFLYLKNMLTGDLGVSYAINKNFPISEMIKARQEQGLTQRDLEKLSGVAQPVIARMEKGTTSPSIDTVLKFLVPLGMTLKVAPIETK